MNRRQAMTGRSNLSLTLVLCLLLAGILASGATSAEGGTTAGSITGRFSVDRIGAATYEIPVQLPPGTAGVAPQLALQYDSHAPEGIAGVGWTLTGFSSVTRCAVRRDGQNYPIAYGPDDRFCLDGAYLVAAPGSTYGADGAIYHPEKQPWVRVRSYGQCPSSGGGPCRFVIEQPSGERFDYGSTEDSAIEAVPDHSAEKEFPSGAVRVWAMARQTDRNGNTVEYGYDEDPSTGEYVPSVVRYTGNTLAQTPLKPQRAVTLRYEATTPVTRFQGGAKVVQSKRLSRIQSCLAPGGVERCDLAAEGLQQVSFYLFDYVQSPATGRDILTTITQGGADGKTLRPQRFEYYAPEKNAYAAPTRWTDEFTWESGWSSSGSQERTVADIDGDGRFDLIGFGQSKTQYALSNGAGFDAAKSQGIYSYNHGYTNNARYPRIIADVDGDGRSDIIGFGNSAVQVSRSLGDRFEEPQSWSREMTYGNGGWDNTKNIRSAADINGDGRSDIIGFGQSKLIFQLSTGNGFSEPVTLQGQFTTDAGYTTPATHPRYMGDVNGDGRADIVGFKSGGVVEVGLSTGEGFLPGEVWTEAFVADTPSGWIPGQNPRFVIDMNGDGLADLVGFRNGDVIVALSTGRSFAAPVVWTTAFTYKNGGWDDSKGTLRTLGDVNGDRLPDIIAFGNTNTYFGINTLGGGFDTEMFEPITDRFGYPSIARNPRFPADAVGNGVSSLIGLGDKSVIVAEPPAPKADLLQSVVNELGGTITVNYASIANGGAVYSPSENRWEYPFRPRVGPVDVVATHTLGDGMGGEYHYAHAYGGAVADLQERGFLGFESVTLIDLQLNPDAPQPGVATTTEYYLPFPRTGLGRAVESVLLESGRVVTRYEYDYEPVTVHPGVFDVRKLSEEGLHYNLANDLSYRTRQSYQYDSFGNLQLLTDFGNTEDPADDSAVCVNFRNDTQAWKIGFPLDSATGAAGRISEGRCSIDAPITRDRWTYTDDVRSNTATHAQYDSANNGWLGTAMGWDEYGNIVTESGAYWTTPDGSGAPTTFNPLTTTYDSEYRTFPIAVANALFAVRDSYDPRFGTKTSHTDPNGVKTTFRYDGFGRAESASGPDPEGRMVELQRWSYEARDVGVLVTHTKLAEWDGTTSWSRELKDGLERVRLTENQSAGGCAIAIEQDYVAVDRISRTSLPRYAADGDQTCERAAPALHVQHRYDPLGRIAETERPGGAITRYTLDMAVLQGVVRDRVTQTDAYGQPEARTYSTFLDPAAKTLRWAFPRQEGADADPVADIQYDALGRMRQLTAPKGVFARWDLDSLGRVSVKTTASSGENRAVYSRKGNLQEESDAEGKRVSWTYDAIGRVFTETLHGADGVARTTTFNYDEEAYSYPIGRLTSVSDPDSSLEQHYDYDPYGNRRQSRLSIDGYQFALRVDYDPLQRAVGLTYPDGARQKKDYAVDGFLADVSVCLSAEECDAARYTSYATFSDFTAMGNPGRAAYKGGATSTSDYQYDPLGRIVSYKTASGAGASLIQQSFEWDHLDQLLSTTDGLDALRSLGFQYDGAGYLTASSIGSRRTEYRYDAIGNLERKGDIAFQNEVTQVRSGTRNGVDVFAADYDKAGNMISRRALGPEGTQHWLQQFDALNRMTSIRRQADESSTSPAEVATFTYDYNNRLVKRVDVESGVVSYYISKNYDVAVMADGSAVYTKYVDGINSPVAAISTNGQTLMSQLPVANAQQPLAAREPFVSPLIATGLSLVPILLLALALTFTGRGGAGWFRRVLNRGACLLLALLVAVPHVPIAAAARLEPGANGPGIPVAGKTLFFHNDQVRSTILVTDPDGAPQAELLYGPYGEIDESTSFGEDNFRAKFAGVELADDVGLYLNAGRFYDPMTGRFVSADDNTVGSSTNNAVQFNRYAYAANNPITHTDPTGHSAASILADIGIGAVAVVVGIMSPVVGVAEIGAFFGGSAVNHTYDPAQWNFKSWKTYGGMAAGIAVSEIGLAVSIAAPEAIPEEAGAFAAFLAGVAADAAVGFAENATYAALGGASGEEILKQGLIGAAIGGGASIAGQGLSAGISRVSSRSFTRAAEAADETATLGSRVGTAVEKEGGGIEMDVMPVCSSFEPGTLIATANGTKPIEAVELGDWVVAFDAEGGITDQRQVTATYSRAVDRTVTLTSTGGSAIVATVEHPFLVEGGGWIEAAQLKPGDAIRTGGDALLTLADVAVQDHHTKVHNISVDGLHTFLVASDGWVVHNVNHFCTSKNAKDLRKNMVADGQNEPAFKNAAHHIVESTDSSRHMVKARAHLKKMGIDINDSSNGIFLARSSRVQKQVSPGSKWSRAYPHSRVHTKRYKRFVWKSIKGANTKQSTNLVLQRIRQQLETGTLPPGIVNWP